MSQIAPSSELTKFLTRRDFARRKADALPAPAPLALRVAASHAMLGSPALSLAVLMDIAELAGCTLDEARREMSDPIVQRSSQVAHDAPAASPPGGGSTILSFSAASARSSSGIGGKTPAGSAATKSGRGILPKIAPPSGDDDDGSFAQGIVQGLAITFIAGTALFAVLSVGSAITARLF